MKSGSRHCGIGDTSAERQWSMLIIVEKSVLVFSAWSSVDDWKSWYTKKDWEKLEKSLAPHLEEPAKIRIFAPGADYAKKAL
jgi:hypothetical protein